MAERGSPTRLARGLRARLLLLALLAVLPAYGLTIYTAVEQRRQAGQAAHAQALDLARLAALQHEHFIHATKGTLRVLSQLPEVRDGSPQQCSQLLAAVLRENPIYANLGVIERDGLLSCSALPAPADIDLSDRAYFRLARDTQDFAVGDYQVGRVTGVPTVNFGYPVHDRGGALSRVVFAALPLTWLNALAAQADLPPARPSP